MPHQHQGDGLQQQDVTQMQDEKQRLGFETPLNLQTLTKGSEILHKSPLRENEGKMTTNTVLYGHFNTEKGVTIVFKCRSESNFMTWNF